MGGRRSGLAISIVLVVCHQDQKIVVFRQLFVIEYFVIEWNGFRDFQTQCVESRVQLSHKHDQLRLAFIRNAFEIDADAREIICLNYADQSRYCLLPIVGARQQLGQLLIFPLASLWIEIIYDRTDW